jgi:hypothetical protein
LGCPEDAEVAVHELSVGGRQAQVSHPTASHRFGYLVSIACNLVGLYIAHHLLDWGWPRFLTSQFDEVLPVITLSCVYGVVINVAFTFYDHQWFTSLANVGGALIGFAVSVTLYVVYPFDFTGYAHDWSWAVTTVLIIGMVVSAIAALAESARGLGSLGSTESS